MTMTILVVATALVVAIIILSLVRVKKNKSAKEMDQPYTRGLNFLLAGEIEKAKEQFSQAVRTDSDNIDAYLKLGALMRQSGQASQAIKVHQSLTIRMELKQAQKVEIYRELASDYLASGSYAKAAEFSDKILSLLKEDRKALKLRIDIAEKEGDWTIAFNLTKRLASVDGVKLDDQLALYRVQEGYKLIDVGKGKDGRIKCREALKIDRKCAPAYLCLVKSYIEEERQDDALKEVRNLLNHNPEKGYLAYDIMEDLYFNLKRFDEIEGLYRDIITERPGDLQASRALARFLHRKGDVDRTLAVCQDALIHFPEDVWMRRYMIRTLLDAGRTEGIGPIAIELLDRIFDERPQFTCSSCGYKTNEALVLCPECSSLGTFKL
ncbi:hypothetical protein CEE37_04535 [candidate division LCP-89 bacterium B3_LCP]|uniref:Uncharacterized protein n=1 Tax=candidate division LCP-89 bacterium B3_LCP TaxID=2012998 RepID=A0A532V3P7_UNCL8|nr:MAG: hypothetical protein CEE37_04535 [candidate division LCP-89 bacterium B3_LCP]